MTNKEAKELAIQMVGDGQTPNKFFVTVSPYITIVDEFGDHDTEFIEGYTEEDTITKVFDTYEDAEYYLDNEVDLDIANGTGYAMIEDRLTGTINEIYLEKVVKVTYRMRQNNDAKRYGYTK